MKEEFKTPLSSIAGSNVFNFRKLAQKYKIEKRHKNNFYKSMGVSIIMTLLSVFDRIRYAWLKRSFKIEEAPIFILGHWRSGTTLLHKFMCRDPKAGFTTTYHTIFPQNIFGLQGLLKKAMHKAMPPRRPHDGLPIHPDFPQEEEFALAHIFSQGFYNWFYFPKNRTEIFEVLNNWEGLTQKQRDSWLKTYDNLVTRSLLDTKKPRYVSKNPANTFRIPQLLKLYPNAKFVYIYRNPYEVYPSSFGFFKSVISNIGFHDISDDEIKEFVLKVFRKLVDKYEKDRLLIPKDNLVEVRYEDFVKSPASNLRKIYTQLGLEITPELEEKWNEDQKQAKSHKTNKNIYDNDLVTETNQYLADYINKKGYNLPREEVSL
jgi:hypothetical protein